MNKKKKILIVLIGIFLVTSILIGMSYALWIFSVSQESTNVVQSDCFEITYSDGNTINLSDTIPLTDKEAKDLDPYTFTIKNICNNAVDYSINIETLEGSTMDLDAVAIKLDGKKKQILGSIEDNQNVVNSNATSSKTIYSSILRVGEEKTHNLRLWVDEDATLEQSMSKSYSSKVVINGVLHPNYNETSLISGPLLNKTFKQLAGTEPTQEEIDNTNAWMNSEDYYSSLFSVDYNVYNSLDDQNVHHIIVTDQHPAAGVTTSVISSSYSSEEVLAWFDTDTIYIYSESNKIYLNEDSSFMFSRLNNLINLDVSNFDTSNVTDMVAMFFGLSNLTSLDVSHFDTSNVTNMESMFEGMNSLTNLDVSNFNTSNVTNMRYMFYELSNLTNLDLSNFNTSNVTDMGDMFYKMSSLTSLDASGFDTSNVTNMSSMFNEMSSLTNLDLSSFNTSNVTDMGWMFDGMSSLTTLDVSNFDTSNVTNMNSMFYGMSSVSKIYVGNNWLVDNVSESRYMFHNSSNLVGGAGTTYNANHTDKEYAVIDCWTEHPGYLTYKGPIGDNAAYCTSMGYDYNPDVE